MLFPIPLWNLHNRYVKIRGGSLPSWPALIGGDFYYYSYSLNTPSQTKSYKYTLNDKQIFFKSGIINIFHWKTPLNFSSCFILQCQIRFPKYTRIYNWLYYFFIHKICIQHFKRLFKLKQKLKISSLFNTQI